MRLLRLILLLTLLMIGCSNNQTSSTEPRQPSEPEHFVGEILDDCNVLPVVEHPELTNIWVHIWVPEGDEIANPVVIVTANCYPPVTDDDLTLLFNSRPDENTLWYCYQSDKLPYDDGSFYYIIDVTTQSDHKVLQFPS